MHACSPRAADTPRLNRRKPSPNLKAPSLLQLPAAPAAPPAAARETALQAAKDPLRHTSSSSSSNSNSSNSREIGQGTRCNKSHRHQTAAAVAACPAADAAAAALAAAAAAAVAASGINSRSSYPNAAAHVEVYMQVLRCIARFGGLTIMKRDKDFHVADSFNSRHCYPSQ